MKAPAGKPAYTLTTPTGAIVAVYGGTDWRKRAAACMLAAGKVRRSTAQPQRVTAKPTQ